MIHLFGRIGIILSVMVTLALIAPAGSEAQICFGCLEETITCGSYSHITQGEDPYVDGPRHDEDCEVGWCIISEDGHGLCTEFAAVLDEEQMALLYEAEPLVRLAINSDDPALMSWLLRRLPDQVTYEANRNAIQIADCKGNRIANYPLSSSRVAGVLAAELVGN